MNSITSDRWLLGSRNSIWLAPMAGVSDPVFRQLCLEKGAGLTYTEMVSAKGLSYENENTANLVTLAPGEERCAVQLFGCDPNIIRDEALRIQESWGDHLAFIDVNMGCPVRKVVKNGEGSALMTKPDQAAAIIRALSTSLDVPVTCKFRSGWDSEHINAVEFAKAMEDAGASAIAVHGRTAAQLYSGKSDWTILAKVKQATSIPVIGSGDLFSHDDCLRMMDGTGVDAVMVARGAQGNPWIFDDSKPSLVNKCSMAIRHERGLYELMGERALGRLRKHMAWYLTGLPHAAIIRNQVMHCDSIASLDAMLCQLKLRMEELEEAQDV